jgi:tRNA A-37 threonylcarbamoyl transferase component Bud32
MGKVMTAAALKLDQSDAGTSSDELAPGTRLLFGQFTIQSFVNSGGFGIVYLATDSLDRQVVIKECFPTAYCRRIGIRVGARSRAQQDDFRSAVRCFVQEAMTLSQLNHPNIVKVHQVFEDNETAYMAMDYVEGHDLLQTVEGTAPPLRPKEIMAHLMVMLDAIGHVHDQGLLHRDISPDNMILNRATGQPVLIDFGASRKDVNRKSRAVSGLRVVKDGYSPQEFYVHGSAQAPCSDLYALAASFYHLISGETPRTSQERLAAIAGRDGDPLRPLAGRFRAYPPQFLRAIDKAMALFPRDRLQSVEEWRAMLGDQAAKPVVAVVAAPVEAEVPARAPSAPTAPAKAVAPVAASPAAPEPAPAFAEPAQRGAGTLQGPKDVLLTAAAATLLLVGLLSLPALFPRDPAGSGSSLSIAAGTVDRVPAADSLPVVNVFKLPNGMAFEAVETATGTLTVVSEVPVGAETTLKTGDVLLVYAASGETLGTPTALREILQREFARGVTTYGFVVRRDASTMDAEFRLGVAG